MKKQIICIIYSVILILGILLIMGCENPVAVKDRSQDTQQVRDENGGRN